MRFMMAAMIAMATCVGARAAPSDAGCAARAAVVLEVLGSGGPDLAEGRASTAYLLWQDGEARLLLDVGGGSYLRWRESGARLASLRHVALTHLHVDHAADLVVLVKAALFDERQDPLSISGPRGGGVFPGLDEYLASLFGAQGPYRYLAGALAGGDGRFALRPSTFDPTPGQRSLVLDTPDLRIEAVGVRHGPVPALAYVVTVGGRRIAFTGDQDGTQAAFWAAAAEADLLVAHVAIADEGDAVAARLHATPTRLAIAAAEARVGQVLLSHWMSRSLAGVDAVRAAFAEMYTGQVIEARDHTCVSVSGPRSGS